MTVETLVIIILILLLIGVVPAWPYSRGWGHVPSAVVILLIVLLVILIL